MSKAKIGFLFGAALVALSTQVQAADAVCSGTSTGGTQAVSAGSFIVNTFTMKCSSNVHLDYLENAQQIGVCAGSAKGNKKYGGSSEGGSVKEASGTYDGGAVTAVAATGC
ncbi:MAG: hypothetical protein H6R07_2377 [Proteobacteria bacterium]|nr:hypothetical protein [Pseudomonadota bacterium]